MDSDEAGPARFLAFLEARGKDSQGAVPVLVPPIVDSEDSQCAASGLVPSIVDSKVEASEAVPEDAEVSEDEVSQDGLGTKSNVGDSGAASSISNVLAVDGDTTLSVLAANPLAEIMKMSDDKAGCELRV